MLFTLNVKHFIKECYIVIVTSFAVKKKSITPIGYNLYQ